MSICLAMIVKDEAATITNCLRSALPLVDSYAIVDTGSTDDTKSMIHEAAKDVPGVVVDHEWLGYGPSRNVAMQEADGADWVLMLDSDMTIEAHPDLRPWLNRRPVHLRRRPVGNRLIVGPDVFVQPRLLGEGRRQCAHVWRAAGGEGLRQITGCATVCRS